jgi:ankyrin repeat protein
MPGSSLDVAHPTITDLAEQLVWATGDAEIARMCLPHIIRPLDDSWWNYVLVHTGNPSKLKVLLEHGIDPNVRGGEGYTLLHLLARLDKSVLGLATLLLDAGASLKVRDSLLQSTPLGWACRWGHIDLVRLYLERGADTVESEAEPWATPLAWATKRGHHEIIQLLRPAGAGA